MTHKTTPLNSASIKNCNREIIDILLHLGLFFNRLHSIKDLPITDMFKGSMKSRDDPDIDIKQTEWINIIDPGSGNKAVRKESSH